MFASVPMVAGYWFGGTRLFLLYIDNVLASTKSLMAVKSRKVPYSYSSGPWGDMAQVQLHVFGEAFQVAYGVNIHLCSQLQDGSW